MLEENPGFSADEVLGALTSLMGSLGKSTVDSRQSSVEEELLSKQAVLKKQQDELTGTSPKVEGYVDPIAQ